MNEPIEEPVPEDAFRIGPLLLVAGAILLLLLFITRGVDQNVRPYIWCAAMVLAAAVWMPRIAARDRAKPSVIVDAFFLTLCAFHGWRIDDAIAKLQLWFSEPRSLPLSFFVQNEIPTFLPPALLFAAMAVVAIGWWHPAWRHKLPLWVAGLVLLYLGLTRNDGMVPSRLLLLPWLLLAVANVVLSSFESSPREAPRNQQDETQA